MSLINSIQRPPVPSGALAPTTNALLEFEGYWWWTNYPFGISGTGYWFNNQQWDPRLATVDSDGLHLKMQKTTLPNGAPNEWSSIEVVLWGDTANNPNAPGTIPNRSYPGYGTYLVAATTSGSFNSIANNCCFGVFTYQFESDPGQTNSHRELDMLECSRWGNLPDPTNAQFTLQPWEPKGNVHRITLKDKGDITIVMDWPDESTPVTYSIYYGIHDLNSLPSTPDITWTTSNKQNTYIPNEGHQTIHFNLWRQPQSVNPSEDQEVIIKKFQYKK
ncbi:hypothetical protein ATE84_4804 [Aquimarina sp. MAR_2010_214]|uniref:hypothetical protein n=1 Tax=Aquimarina sp. MAR_2010_214 TaxID=1250026 RepID=UPI000C704C0F|nr:hypothetical protein [Aquimarina sp. MAR_2010_214]PKV52684.1 hypothetical protein ATE84_4804 [Aquimarina sp. MAR_2010_214]